MSVAIRWAALPDGKSFHGGTSTDLEILREVFGDKIELHEEHVPYLRAMAKVQRFPGGEQTFFDEVADAIEAAGSIRVWGVW